MKEIVQQELLALAEKIIRNANQLNASTLQQEARLLYERAVVLAYLTDNQPQQTASAQQVVASPKANEIKGFGAATRQPNSFLQESKTIQKTESTQPIFPSINNIVQKPQQPVLEDILAEIPKEQPVFEQKNPLKETNQKTLNDIISNRAIQLGLNDRIAFISHLFEGNERDFAEAINALNNLTSEQEAIRFIQQKIKPVFNNWIGKEEYEERFVEVVSKKFS